MRRGYTRSRSCVNPKIIYSFQSHRNFILHPLIHSLLYFDLAQNTVGGQVYAVEKVTPIG